MSHARKYEDFTESAPCEMPSKHQSGSTRFYISITCPHCIKVFVDIPQEQLQMSKASRCLQHLRVCEAFKAKGGEVASVPEKKKYIDFTESDPQMKPGKKAPWTVDNYVGITCPHCSMVFVELTVDNLKSSKASQCLKHLRVCEAFKAKGGEVAPPPEKTSSSNEAALQATIDRQDGEIKRLKLENESIKEEKKALRDIAVQICEEDMYNCFFDFGAGASSSDIQTRMNAAVKAWGKARREQSLKRLAQ